MKKYLCGAVFLLLAVAVAAVTIPTIGAYAAPFSFDNNLSMGTQNSADVTALQQFLTAQGVYSGPVTGNFFSLTLQGVKRFQAANNVTPVSGFFGPLTRAKANAIVLSENQSVAAATSSLSILPSITPSIISTAPSSTGSATSTGVVAGASTESLALIQAQLNSMYQTVKNFQTQWSRRNHQPATTTPQVPPAPTAPAIAPAITILPAALPTATATVAYGSVILVASTTAAEPFTWTMPSGSLPVGLTFTPSPTTATLAGTPSPSAIGTFAFSLHVTNGTSSSTKSYSLSVGALPVSNPTPTPTASAAPTSPSSMLWGAYVGDIDSNPALVAGFDTQVGATSQVVATFADLSSGDFPSWEKPVVGSVGKTLLVFLEPQYSFSQINSGKYDTILQQYASAAAAYGSPIILAPFDEFNLNENPWGYGVGGNTPASFVQAWQHIHSFFANVPNVKFALVYNNVSEPADGVNTYAAYWPGSAYVDYVGVDGFNFGTTSASAQSFDQIFNPIMPTLESFGKPILFSSIGSLEFPGKAQWLSYGLGTYIEKYPNIAGWVYFDFNDTGAGQNWSLTTDPSALAAFQQVIP